MINRTQVPVTIPVGDTPIPDIDADVAGSNGIAQGRSLVGRRIFDSE